MKKTKEKNKKNKYMSLSVKLPILFGLNFIVVCIIVLVCVFMRFHNQMIDTYTRMADGLTNLMIEPLDTDKIDEYAEVNFESEEYRQIVKYYYSLRDNYMDVLYLYVYDMSIDNDGIPSGKVVFDLDEEYSENPGEEEVDWIGEIYELDEPFASQVPEMVEGKKIIAHDVHTKEDGYLFSYVKPVLNDEGEYVCSACVDFSMSYMYMQDIKFLIIMFMVLALVLLVIFIIDIRFITNTLTDPLGKISQCTSAFSYETEEARYNNVKRVEELNIDKQDEIGDIYHVFLSVLKDSADYMSKFEKAKKDIEKKDARINYMGKTMYKDDLTGVGNKAAYTEISKELDEQIKDNKARFAVMMVDINNLKYVNDTYGHEKGDGYINGCCSIMKKICKGSPIYRIGGDEFVILLQGHSMKISQQLVAKLMIEFNRAYKDTAKEEYERYSASIGLSQYAKGDDSVNTVFKRADNQMYENKKEFKKKNGSYR